MKRTVLCFFSYLLILLVFCTLISAKVEDEMMTLVNTRTAEARNGRSVMIGTISLDWENTENVMYILSEGSGWEDGLRVSFVPSKYYQRLEGDKHVTLGAGTSYLYVYSASREPILGSEVRVVDPGKGADSYLVWNPEPIESLEGMASYMQVETQTDNALLFSMHGAAFPYFEHNLWYRFREIVGTDVRLYSLHDVQQFTECLPWIAGIAAVLFVSLILWAGSWILQANRGRCTGVWIANTLVIAALFLCLPWLQRQFDLPASLMPRDYILDFPHYARTFERIKASMDAFGIPTVREWLSEAGGTCAWIAAAAVLLPVGILIAERLLCRRAEKRSISTRANGDGSL